jgi:alkane 1-monooxygenase
MSAVRYFAIYLIAVAFLRGWWSAGAWPLVVPLWVFVLIPALDAVVGRDDRDPEPGPGSFLHDLALRLWVPVQLGLVALTLWTAPSLAWGERLLLAASLGILTGAGGINVAHELVHRKSKLDRALGEVLMASVSYTWFCVEHVLGHHRRVATPADPASARLGESVYAFVPRSVAGGLASFVAIEGDYAGRRGIRWWSLRDRRTRYLLGLVGLYAALLALGGPIAVIVFAVQSAVAIVLLEVINYVEHYGLVRSEVRPGEYERVQPRHSWNSTHVVTGAFLFNLPRHADHHAFASRPYWQLRAWPDSPQLPLGYATMVVVALFPPLWFRMMDPAVARVSARSSDPPRASSGA